MSDVSGFMIFVFFLGIGKIIVMFGFLCVLVEDGFKV